MYLRWYFHHTPFSKDFVDCAKHFVYLLCKKEEEKNGNFWEHFSSMIPLTLDELCFRDVLKKNAALIWVSAKTGMTPPLPQGILKFSGHFSKRPIF